MRQRVVLGGGNAAGADDRPPESPTHARARAVAAQRLERIAAACELTDRQQLQLRLAVESDIRRFAAAIDTMRTKYAGVQVNLNDQEGQKTWHQFQQDVEQCRRLLRGLFEGDSLFARSLVTTLDAAQLAGIETETRERRAFRWRAMVSVMWLFQTGRCMWLFQSGRERVGGDRRRHQQDSRMPANRQGRSGDRVDLCDRGVLPDRID